MHQRLNLSTKVALAVILLYGLYLGKTLLGINVSNQYSASWILKAPLQPLLTQKKALCQEFETLCTWRSNIKATMQDRIKTIKQMKPVSG